MTPLVIPDATKLYIITEDTEYPIYDGAILFESTNGPTYLYYVADSGLGMAPLTRFAERGPRQHGETDIGYALSPRDASIILAIHAPPADTSADLETARELLLRIFRPSDTPIVFRYDRSNGAKRQIDGFVVGGLQFGSEDRQVGTWFQRFNVDIRMPDPTFYDPGEHTASFMNNTLDDAGFEVPLAIPMHVRSDRISVVRDIFYDGSADASPVITLYGPLYAPALSNLTTGTLLDFPGRSIPAGGSYTIDLRTGFKTVVDQDGTDRTAELSDESDLDAWSLFVSRLPQRVVCTADYVGAQNEVARITWHTRYVGI